MDFFLHLFKLDAKKLVFCCLVFTVIKNYLNYILYMYNIHKWNNALSNPMDGQTFINFEWEI